MNDKFICEDNRYRYIYKITIKSTNQYYIGKHSTLNFDDGYMGSGVGILEYYNQNGYDDVIKEIIMFAHTDKELLEYERIQVGDKWKTDPLCLNRVPGGTFNWTWKDDPRFPTKESYSEFCKNKMKKWRESLTDEEYNDYCKKVSDGIIKYVNTVGHDGLYWTGKHHTEETKERISLTKSLNPQYGKKNGMFNKKWIYNPITQEEMVIDKSETIPDGWKSGHIDRIDKETRQRINKENLIDATGMVRAYNPINNETHLYKSDDDIPNGFVRGNPKLNKRYSIEISNEIRKKISENTIKGMWKDRDYNAVVELHRKIYKVYLEEGFKAVCIQFNYDKSQQNLIQRFRRYLPEYKGYQRNKSLKFFRRIYHKNK